MIRFSLLRGVCQIPAYVAQERQFFANEGLESEIKIEPTAWMVPTKLIQGDTQFAVIPWTRVAAGEQSETPMCVLSGSGWEEAAIVVRAGMAVEEVKRVSVPLRGGIKDLTAMGLIDSLGWKNVDILRQPSGDGAIISFFGQGVDAASMVEPYATMLEELGVGRVLKRTGDLWKGAPGCSLSTTTRMVEERPDLCGKVVRAFVKATRYVNDHPQESAEIAHRYIGIHPRFIEKALTRNPPRNEAILSKHAMENILNLMLKLGYLKQLPSAYSKTSFLQEAYSNLGISLPTGS
jgi:ABC-type nitrate/sulfonate/bicarbonate transport system substrate-binding protein